MYYLSQNVGNLIALFSGLLLPDDKDTAALMKSNMWFYIYAFPLVFYAIMAGLMFTIVVHDSPKYSIVSNKRKECLAVLNQIYKTDGNQELTEEISDFIESTI